MGNAIIDTFSKEELAKIVANSHSMAEVVDKLGYATHNGRNSNTVKERLKKYNISTEHFEYKTPVKRNEKNVFCEFSTASQHTLKRWYLKQDNLPDECAICGQKNYWNGKELVLILDHINGDKHDNRLENLRLICPNCNQQLDTTKKRNTYSKRCNKKRKLCKLCGKEISPTAQFCTDCDALMRRKVNHPSREELKIMISKLPFTKIGQYYNVTDNTIRKWCKQYNLPYNYHEIRELLSTNWDAV